MTPAEKIISKGYGNYILFQGNPIFREFDNTLITARFGSTLKLEDLLDGKGETIYKIGSFTIPQQFLPIK